MLAPKLDSNLPLPSCTYLAPWNCTPIFSCTNCYGLGSTLSQIGASQSCLISIQSKLHIVLSGLVKQYDITQDSLSKQKGIRCSSWLKHHRIALHNIYIHAAPQVQSSIEIALTAGLVHQSPSAPCYLLFSELLDFLCHL
jgi:hypothetical protein